MSAATPAAARRAGAAGPLAVQVHGLRKDFRLPHEQVHTLKERALHPFRPRTYEQLHALDGVSFAVGDGEFFGVVGRNGSGKSTLLRCLAGIYDVDAGDIAIAGRVSPFIELGVGFNPELTARDNVILNALMLGLTRREAEEGFDAIIAFAELEQFLDLKLKNYSSGMQVRLGFSVAIQARAEVLLVDEVLAVGDAAFQQKCFEQFHRMKDEGRTVIFVTHDMSAVERFCDRAMLLERGRIADIGEPADIARHYNELNFGRTVHRKAPAAETPDDGPQAADEAGRYGGGGAVIRRAWFEDAAGEEVDAIGQGDRCRVAVEVAFREALEEPVVAITLRNEARITVLAIASDWRHGSTGSFAVGDTAVVRFAFDMWLAPARYSLTPSIARRGSGADALDLRADLAELLVYAAFESGGTVDLPHDIEIERR